MDDLYYSPNNRGITEGYPWLSQQPAWEFPSTANPALSQWATFPGSQTQVMAPARPPFQQLSDAYMQERPRLTFVELIEEALTKMGDLTVKEIYKCIVRNHTFYKHLDNARWQPHIRHTLSTSRRFKKSGEKKGGYKWTLVPDDQKQPPKDHWKKLKLAEYSKFEGFPHYGRKTFKHVKMPSCDDLKRSFGNAGDLKWSFGNAGEIVDKCDSLREHGFNNWYTNNCLPLWNSGLGYNSANLHMHEIAANNSVPVFNNESVLKSPFGSYGLGGSFKSEPPGQCSNDRWCHTVEGQGTPSEEYQIVGGTISKRNDSGVPNHILNFPQYGSASTRNAGQPELLEGMDYTSVHPQPFYVDANTADPYFAGYNGPYPPNVSLLPSYFYSHEISGLLADNFPIPSPLSDYHNAFYYPSSSQVRDDVYLRLPKSTSDADFVSQASNNGLFGSEHAVHCLPANQQIDHTGVTHQSYDTEFLNRNDANCCPQMKFECNCDFGHSNGDVKSTALLADRFHQNLPPENDAPSATQYTVVHDANICGEADVLRVRDAELVTMQPLSVVLESSDSGWLIVEPQSTANSVNNECVPYQKQEPAEVGTENPSDNPLSSPGESTIEISYSCPSNTEEDPILDHGIGHSYTKLDCDRDVTMPNSSTPNADIISAMAAAEDEIDNLEPFAAQLIRTIFGNISNEKRDGEMVINTEEPDGEANCEKNETHVCPEPTMPVVQSNLGCKDLTKLTTLPDKSVTTAVDVPNANNETNIECTESGPFKVNANYILQALLQQSPDDITRRQCFVSKVYSSDQASKSCLASLLSSSSENVAAADNGPASFSCEEVPSSGETARSEISKFEVDEMGPLMEETRGDRSFDDDSGFIECCNKSFFEDKRTDLAMGKSGFNYIDMEQTNDGTEVCQGKEVVSTEGYFPEDLLDLRLLNRPDTGRKWTLDTVKNAVEMPQSQEVSNDLARYRFHGTVGLNRLDAQEDEGRQVTGFIPVRAPMNCYNLQVCSMKDDELSTSLKTESKAEEAADRQISKQPRLSVSTNYTKLGTLVPLGNSDKPTESKVSRQSSAKGRSNIRGQEKLKRSLSEISNFSNCDPCPATPATRESKVRKSRSRVCRKAKSFEETRQSSCQSDKLQASSPDGRLQSASSKENFTGIEEDAHSQAAIKSSASRQISEDVSHYFLMMLAIQACDKEKV